MSFVAAIALITFPALSGPGREVDMLVRRLMEVGEVPGLSIVVIDRAKIAWERSYGVANGDIRAPLSDRHVFESASLGKPVFAYAVLKLVDAGLMSLDMPLQEYLPQPGSDE